MIKRKRIKFKIKVNSWDEKGRACKERDKEIKGYVPLNSDNFPIAIHHPGEKSKEWWLTHLASGYRIPIKTELKNCLELALKISLTIQKRAKKKGVNLHDKLVGDKKSLGELRDICLKL